MRSWFAYTVVVAIAIFGGSGTKHNRVWSATADRAVDLAKVSSTPSQILRARVPGAKQEQLWLYEGALYDPLDGRRIANVQGLELVRPLQDTAHLAIDPILNHPNATYEDATTVWTQKIFCYTTTTINSSENDPKKARIAVSEPTTRETILNNVRVRPQSPRKHVPLDQAVAVYETATTFISKNKRNDSRNKSGKTNDDDDDDDELLVHSEWPNGQTMWGTAQGCKQQGGAVLGGMDYTIFAKLRNKYSPLYSPNLVPEDPVDQSKKEPMLFSKWRKPRQNDKGDVVLSPKRAALVQFGSADKTMETKHKYGARETYSYRNIGSTGEEDNASPRPWWPFPSGRKNSSKASSSSRTSVYYTRYGEGPPFYAPGRMCMLELRGKPIESLDEATPLLKELLEPASSNGAVVNFHCSQQSDDDDDNEQRNIPSIQFAWNRKSSGKSASTRSHINTRRHSTTGKHLLRLEMPEHTDDDIKGGTRTRIRVWTKQGKERAEVLWDRLRASTVLQDAGS